MKKCLLVIAIFFFGVLWFAPPALALDPIPNVTPDESGNGDCYCRACGESITGQKNCNDLALIEKISQAACDKKNNATFQCIWKERLDYCCCKDDGQGHLECKKTANYKEFQYCNASIYDDTSFNPTTKATDNATDFFTYAGTCSCKSLGQRKTMTADYLNVRGVNSCNTSDIRSKINPNYTNCVGSVNSLTNGTCECYDTSPQALANTPAVEVDSLWEDDCKRLEAFKAIKCEWIVSSTPSYTTNESGYQVQPLASCDVSALTGAGTNVRSTVDTIRNNATRMNQLVNFLSPGGSATDATRSFIGQGIKVLTAFMGTIMLVLYVYAAILWMTAAGNTEQVDKAKTIITWATLGAAAMLGSYLVAKAIFAILKSPPLV